MIAMVSRSLHGGESEASQRLDRVGADAGPGETPSHQHVGTEQEGEHHAERGDDGSMALRKA